MKILIIEDEPAASRRLGKMLLQVRPGIEIVGYLETVKAAVTWFRADNKTDLCLMDIHLADGSCFEIFQQTDLSCPIIFTTAYDQYALQAFKVNSIDYLLKPVKPDELLFALEKFERQKQQDSNALLAGLLEHFKPETRYTRRFAVKSGSLIRSVESHEIVAFYSEDKLNFLHDNQNRRYPIDLSLDKIQEMLDPVQFFRINRSTVIQYAYIHQMHAHLKGRIKIDMKVQLPGEIMVSADRAANFKDWIGRG